MVDMDEAKGNDYWKIEYLSGTVNVFSFMHRN